MSYDESRVLERFGTRGGLRRPGRLAASTRKAMASPAPARLVPAQSLAAGEMLAISDGVATTLRIESGEVWLTEEGSFVDHILCAGRQYTFDRSGRAIVAAQTASRVSLYSPGMGVPPRSVERCNPGHATGQLLYARSRWLNAIALLIPSWARRLMVSI